MSSKEDSNPFIPIGFATHGESSGSGWSDQQYRGGAPQSSWQHHSAPETHYVSPASSLNSTTIMPIQVYGFMQDAAASNPHHSFAQTQRMSASLPSSSSEHSCGSSKRNRDETAARHDTSINESTVLSTGTQQKRARERSYTAPRKTPMSFTAAIGTLVNNGSHDDKDATGVRVHFRRELSASKIEAFLSDHSDAMDVDPIESRPRSMSL